jgi:hypothetical protein
MTANGSVAIVDKKQSRRHNPGKRDDLAYLIELRWGEDYGPARLDTPNTAGGASGGS